MCPVPFTVSSSTQPVRDDDDHSDVKWTLCGVIFNKRFTSTTIVIVA